MSHDNNEMFSACFSEDDSEIALVQVCPNFLFDAKLKLSRIYIFLGYVVHGTVLGFKVAKFADLNS